MDKGSVAEHREYAAEVRSDEDLRSGEEGDFKFTFGKFLACLSFQLGYLSDIFALTSVSTVLSVINNDLGPSPSYTWIAAAQNVPVACLSPVVGRLGDIFGRRNFILAGNVFGAVGCVVAATAKDVNVCIAGNTLMGIGQAMHQICWSSLGEIVPKKDRAHAMGWLEASLMPAAVFGAPTAYAMVANGSWRPIYWLCFALDIVSLVLVFFFYHPINQYIREEGKTVFQQLKEIDLVGLVLFTAGTVLFLLGLSFGGQQHPWKSAETLAPLLVGAALLVAVGLYSALHQTKYALFPAEVFRNTRGFIVIIVGVFLYGMSLSSTPILWPQQVAVLYTQTPLTIGWYGMAMGIGGTIGAPTFGWVAKRIGKYHILFPALIGLLTLFSGCQATLSEHSQASSAALVVLVGFCIASSSILASAMLQLATDHAYIGIVTGFGTSSRAMGGSVAQVIFVSILQQKLNSNLARKVAGPLAKGGVSPAEIPEVIEALLGGHTSSPLLQRLTPGLLGVAVEGVKQSFIGSFRVVYLSTIAFGAVATVVACFSQNLDAQNTKRVDIKLEEGAHIHTHEGGEDQAEKGREDVD